MFVKWTIYFQTNQNDDDGRTAYQLFIRHVTYVAGHVPSDVRGKIEL